MYFATEFPLEIGPEYSKGVYKPEDVRAVFGDGTNPMLERVILRPAMAVQDEFVDVAGQDLFEIPLHTGLALGLMIYVAGEKCKDEYCEVIERKIHQYLNNVKGISHVGQRDHASMSVTYEFTKKHRFRDIGNYLIQSIKTDFGTVVDKVQVRFIVALRMLPPYLTAAREEFAKRDAVDAGLIDNEVADFYSCSICQSVHPNHLCIITPERSGMCGGVDYKTCKISEEIDVEGPYKKVAKGTVINEETGEFTGINETVKKETQERCERLSLYSMMDAPLGITIQAENVAIVLPKCNGVMCMTRYYKGPTPSGITNKMITDDIRDSTPAVMGFSLKNFAEPSFIKAEGGIKRIVWMDSELKKKALEEFKGNAEITEFITSLADEKVGTDEDSVLEYLKNNNHPALAMRSII